MKKERIWEIDALRGFMILCMIVFHTVIASRSMIAWYPLPRWLEVFMGRAGTLFVILSGISATLGKRSFRRGIMVFGCALVLALGTYLAAALGLLDAQMVIRFGVLHLLGISMMLWPLLKNSKVWVLLVLGAVIIGVGYWFETLRVSSELLFAIGLRSRQFASGDYYPIFPQLGWFLLGGVIGKWLYPEKKTLLPKADSDNVVCRFLCMCGRNSLVIYLVHFPAIGGILMLIRLFLDK